MAACIYILYIYIYSARWIYIYMKLLRFVGKIYIYRTCRCVPHLLPSKAHLLPSSTSARVREDTVKDVSGKTIKKKSVAWRLQQSYCKTAAVCVAALSKVKVYIYCVIYLLISRGSGSDSWPYLLWTSGLLDWVVSCLSRDSTNCYDGQCFVNTSSYFSLNLF